MPFAELPSGVRIHYETRGEGRPLLLCTGLGGLGAFWNAYVEPLARDRRVITYDHVGTGESTITDPPYDVGQMAEDAIGLLDFLGLEAVDFVGHSTGGAIGQLLASRHPKRIRSLLLAATWGRRDPYFTRCFDARIPILERIGKLEYFQATSLLIYPPDWISEDFPRVEALEALNAEALARPDILIARIRAICDFDASDEWTRIDCPTLVVGARDDMTTASFFSKELAREIAGAELTMLAWGAHMFPLTNREAFLPILMDWLRRQDRSA